MISQTKRTLPENTQLSQETYVHVPAGIRTRSTTNTEAADPRLRTSSHGDQPLSGYPVTMDNPVEIDYGLDDLCFDSR